MPLGDAKTDTMLVPYAGADRADAGQRTISTNIYCIKCGYNLRGLYEMGQCPECGFALAPSINCARSGWTGSRVHRISRGKSTTVWALIVALAAALVVVLLVGIAWLVVPLLEESASRNIPQPGPFNLRLDK